MKKQFEEEEPAGGIFYPRPAHKKGVADGEEEQGKLTSCWMLVTWPSLSAYLSVGGGRLRLAALEVELLLPEGTWPYLCPS